MAEGMTKSGECLREEIPCEPWSRFAPSIVSVRPVDFWLSAAFYLQKHTKLLAPLELVTHAHRNRRAYAEKNFRVYSVHGSQRASQEAVTNFLRITGGNAKEDGFGEPLWNFENLVNAITKSQVQSRKADSAFPPAFYRPKSAYAGKGKYLDTTLPYTIVPALL